LTSGLHLVDRVQHGTFLICDTAKILRASVENVKRWVGCRGRFGFVIYRSLIAALMMHLHWLSTSYTRKPEVRLPRGVVRSDLDQRESNSSDRPRQTHPRHSLRSFSTHVSHIVKVEDLNELHQYRLLMSTARHVLRIDPRVYIQRICL